MAPVLKLVAPADLRKSFSEKLLFSNNDIVLIQKCTSVLVMVPSETEICRKIQCSLLKVHG